MQIMCDQLSVDQINREGYQSTGDLIFWVKVLRGRLLRVLLKAGGTPHRAAQNLFWPVAKQL